MRTIEELLVSIRADLDFAARPGRAEFVFPDTLAAVAELALRAEHAERQRDALAFEVERSGINPNDIVDDLPPG